MAWISAHWQQLVLATIGVLTLIQEILALMGHGSGAITSVISFLSQFTGQPTTSVVSPPTPPATK